MTRVEADRYLVMIRSDYLFDLGKFSNNRQERDRVIQRAVEDFLTSVEFEERRRIIEGEEGRLGIVFSAGHKQDYHMYLESVNLPDYLVAQMDMANRDPDFDTPVYDSLGTVLNAAIKVYLESHSPSALAAQT